MKTLITSIFLLTLTFTIQAQERKLEQVDNNLYKYEYINDEGKVSQTGYYKKIEGSFEPHGFWVDYSGNKTKAKYHDGVMVWIKVKGQRKYTFEEIQLRKLSNKIARLEKQVLTLTN